MIRHALLLSIVACGARTGLDAPRPDAGGEASVLPLCDFGTIVADAFGATTWWNGGASLPAGHYVVTYVDGCMKYAASQGWTVNAYADGPDTLYVVTNGGDIVARAPGTIGFALGQGGFPAFDACVAANHASAPLEFDFAGGAIGLWLADGPYDDNVAGTNGRNPTYRLSACK